MVKILFHFGASIDANTVVKVGSLNDDIQRMYIEHENGKYFLDDIKAVSFYTLNSFGTMVKLQNAEDSIFLSVPRIFINVGTGFAIINRRKTQKLKQSLEAAMERQKANLC